MHAGVYVIIGGNGNSVYNRLIAAMGRPDMGESGRQQQCCIRQIACRLPASAHDERLEAACSPAVYQELTGIKLAFLPSHRHREPAVCDRRAALRERARNPGRERPIRLGFP